MEKKLSEFQKQRKANGQRRLAAARCSTKSAAKTVYALEWPDSFGKWVRSVRRFDSPIQVENLAEYIGANRFRVIKITTSEQIL